MAADEDTEDGPPPRPPIPRRRREGIVIEGEATVANAYRASARPGVRDLAAAALGGAVGAALALGGAFLLTSARDPSPLARRVEALEAAVQADAPPSDPTAAQAQMAKLAADEAETRKRQTSLADSVARLQGAATETERRLAALEGAALRADETARTLAADVAALRADLGRTQARLDADEGALAAGAQPRPADARLAVATRLRERLRTGEALGGEIAALERLGVDPSALSPLRPFAATGAPSPAALARSLREAAPRLSASPSASGANNRLLNVLQGLVKTRKVGETHAAEADVLARAEGALERGDLAGALAALGDLPLPAREAAKGLRDAVEARLAADKAAEALARGAEADPSARR